MKKIYSQQKTISKLHNKLNNICLSVSKYTDTLILIINQNGTIGSLLKGQVTEMESYFRDEWEQNQEENCYNIKVMFGSTQIQFYELLFRRILSTIFEKNILPKTTKVILQISLPLKNKDFSTQLYYNTLLKETIQLLTNVI